MKILRNVGILICILILTYYFGFIFGRLYMLFFTAGNGGIFSISSSDAQYIVGWPLIYIFLTTLLFTIFGGIKKNIWIIALLVPAAIIELYLDFSHIYFPLAIGLVGWGLGWLILKGYTSLRKR